MYTESGCTQTDALTITWISMWVGRHGGKRNANAPLFKSVTCRPQGEWMCGGEKSKKGRLRCRHGVDPLCVLSVFPLPVAHRWETTCLSGGENRFPQEDVAWPYPAVRSLLMILFSLFLHVYFLVFLACASVVLKDRRARLRFFLFSSVPPSTSSSLWIPCCFSCTVGLQVVREQDLREHMRAKRGIVTDLIAERERRAERERDWDKVCHDARTFFQNLLC